MRDIVQHFQSPGAENAAKGLQKAKKLAFLRTGMELPVAKLVRPGQADRISDVIAISPDRLIFQRIPRIQLQNTQKFANGAIVPPTGSIRPSPDRNSQQSLSPTRECPLACCRSCRRRRQHRCPPPGLMLPADAAAPTSGHHRRRRFHRRAHQASGTGRH